MCSKNSSCLAYTNINIRGSNNCLMWFGDLIDMKHYTVIGEIIYIRMARPELGKNHLLNAVTLMSGISACKP